MNQGKREKFRLKHASIVNVAEQKQMEISGTFMLRSEVKWFSVGQKVIVSVPGLEVFS